MLKLIFLHSFAFLFSAKVFAESLRDTALVVVSEALLLFHSA